MKAIVSAIVTAVVIQLSFPNPSHAASIEGRWSGRGFVKPVDGPREKVRCRITYSKVSKKLFAVRASCATTSTKISQTGEVLKVSPSRYAGDFYNKDYDVSGRVRVKLSGSSQTVSFSSVRGYGRVTLRRR